MAFVVAVFSTPARRRAAEEILRQAGHTCVVFGDPVAAAAEAAAGAADVVVVDGRLPGGPLTRVCAATGDLPVVICAPIAGASPVVGRRVVVADLERSALPAAVAEVLAARDADTGERPDTVLLVEDDHGIAEPLVEGLARYGIRVCWVTTGAEALAAPRSRLVLLDLGLPDLDGLQVCRELRAAGDVPIIMLTARGDETDRVVGLELGADDYLPKPFSLRELVARIHAVGRRVPAGGAAVGGRLPGGLAG